MDAHDGSAASGLQPGGTSRHGVSGTATSPSPKQNTTRLADSQSRAWPSVGARTTAASAVALCHLP